ncbi:hypothetical protein HYV30_03435 [Candidatus Kaiserbacteria bacterium]|nr:hypothetical protein [Candidatus Kaiserbacteria bacterium]
MRFIKPALGVALGSMLSVIPFAGIAVAATPVISFTGSSTTPFSTLSIAGSGFQPGESVLISFGLSSANSTADSAGAFSSVPLAIPALPSAQYYIVAVGQTSGLVAFTGIFVQSFFPIVAPNTWYIAPGSTLSWAGSGFAPNENITVTDSQGATIASFPSDGSGAFTSAGAMVVPFSLRNSSATFTLKGSRSSTSFPITITVSDLFPLVTPTTWYAAPGTPVSFSATGFGPGEGVSIYLATSPVGNQISNGASTDAIAHVAASEAGAVSAGPYNLPFGTTAAEYRFVGDESGASVTLPITLAGFYPSLNPSAYYAAPTSQISVDGSGFAGNEPITLWMNDVSVGSTTSDSFGNFPPMSFALPATPNSTVLVRAQGNLSEAAANFTMTIGQYYPNVTPDAWFTYPGNSVTFSGTGFGANETVAVSGAGSATTTTDATGGFSGVTVKVPLSASGIASVAFNGMQSTAAQTIGIALGVRNPAIWFDNYYAFGGTPLTVFGAGFGNNESVALSTASSVFDTVTADASGKLAAPTAIPFAPAGPLSITATGADTGVAASASLTLATVYTDFQLGSYTVAAGSPIRFLGNGYLPNDPITVTTDRSTSTPVASFTASATGSFDDSSFVVPVDWTSGNLTVTAHGGHSFTDTPITLWVLGQ